MAQYDYENGGRRKGTVSFPCAINSAGLTVDIKWALDHDDKYSCPNCDARMFVKRFEDGSKADHFFHEAGFGSSSRRGMHGYDKPELNAAIIRDKEILRDTLSRWTFRIRHCVDEKCWVHQPDTKMNFKNHDVLMDVYVPIDGKKRYVNLAIYPKGQADHNKQPEAVIMVFHDVRPDSSKRRVMKKALTETRYIEVSTRWIDMQVKEEHPSVPSRVQGGMCSNCIILRQEETTKRKRRTIRNCAKMRGDFDDTAPRDGRLADVIRRHEEAATGDSEDDEANSEQEFEDEDAEMEHELKELLDNEAREEPLPDLEPADPNRKRKRLADDDELEAQYQRDIREQEEKEAVARREAEQRQREEQEHKDREKAIQDELQRLRDSEEAKRMQEQRDRQQKAWEERVRLADQKRKKRKRKARPDSKDASECNSEESEAAAREEPERQLSETATAKERDAWRRARIQAAAEQRERAWREQEDGWARGDKSPRSQKLMAYPPQIPEHMASQVVLSIRNQSV